MSQEPLGTFGTQEHYTVLNKGGLMMIHMNHIDPEFIALEDLIRYPETVYLSPLELLDILKQIEPYRKQLEEWGKEVDTYFTQVAEAWLEECEKSPRGFVEKGNEWSLVYRNARDLLFKSTDEETNAILAGWYKQSFNPQFPHDQQLELLNRYFKRLYYARYPDPVSDLVDDEDVDTDRKEEEK